MLHMCGLISWTGTCVYIFNLTDTFVHINMDVLLTQRMMPDVAGEGSNTVIWKRPKLQNTRAT